MKKNIFADLFIDNRWYLLISLAIGSFIFAFFIPVMWYISMIYFLVLSVCTLLDLAILFIGKRSVVAQRIVKERFNLGEENKVDLSIQNTFPFPVSVRLIDEQPIQFQNRKFKMNFSIQAGKRYKTSYDLKPLSRGEYTFDRLLCYVRSPLGLLQRRCINEAEQTVKVYPSTKYLRQYQLLASSENNQYVGNRQVRKLGQSLEFEQIKEYVPGDDIRTINWKATARKGGLMVNNYIDARSQQIYCLIDKGRAMKMSFDGMSLLDYAINASLIFLNIALLKQDRAGLITYASKVNDFIAAEKSALQINKLNETLYRQTTDFSEAGYEELTAAVYRKLSQRTFLMMFTNFETMASLRRQLPYLKRLASRHLVCIVFFQNTLLTEIHEAHPDTLEGIYIKTIADKFHFEKKQIVKELRRHGILSILTTPETLTVDVVNKYLELKARQMV